MIKIVDLELWQPVQKLRGRCEARKQGCRPRRNRENRKIVFGI